MEKDEYYLTVLIPLDHDEIGFYLVAPKDMADDVLSQIVGVEVTRWSTDSPLYRQYDPTGTRSVQFIAVRSDLDASHVWRVVDHLCSCFVHKNDVKA